jgi:hypothetical protein
MEDLLRSSVELKKAHVLRYYDKCKAQNKSDEVCLRELEALHPREIEVLNKILGFTSKYDQFALSKAMAGCYDPSHDYKDLIACWEQLAGKMEVGQKLEVKPDEDVFPLGTMELTGLTPFEQKSVVLCVRGTINKNYSDTVANALKMGGREGLWALKVHGLENMQMSELARAAKWTEMESYYRTETINVEKLIRGQSSNDAYMLASKNNESNIKRTLEPEIARQSEHARNFQKLASVCKGISSTIISKAKAGASD